MSSTSSMRIPDQDVSLQKYMRALRLKCLEYGHKPQQFIAEDFYKELVLLSTEHFKLWEGETPDPEYAGRIDPEYNYLEYNKQCIIGLNFSRGITVGLYKYSKIDIDIQAKNGDHLSNLMYLCMEDISPDIRYDSEEQYSTIINDVRTEQTTYKFEYTDQNKALYELKYYMEERPHRSELHPVQVTTIQTQGRLKHRPLFDTYRFGARDPWDSTSGDIELDYSMILQKDNFRSLPKEMKEFEYSMKTGKDPKDHIRENMTTWNIKRIRAAQNKAFKEQSGL